MSTVGLTKAMREALENVDTLYARSDKFVKRMCDLGLIRYGECCGLRVVEITPRGHAALAAPRMTRKEYGVLERCEKCDGATTALRVATTRR